MTQTPPIPPQDPDSQVPSPAAVIVTEPKAVGLAIAALVLGICAFIPCLGFILGPIAVILAIVALAVGTTAKGRAIAGLVLAVVGFVIMIGLALLLPSLSYGPHIRGKCAVNLNGIGKGIAMYRYENQDVFPVNLQILIESGHFSSNDFTCPSAKAGRQIDYFYLPATKLSPDNAIVACDFRDNHGNFRNVLRTDCNVRKFSEHKFQEALQEPQNAAFAAALRAAE